MAPLVPPFISQITPLLSLAVAITALLFTAWQYFDRKTTENSLRRSRIIMRLGAVKEGNIVFEKNEILDKFLFRQKYCCILSNIGYVNDKLIAYDIYHMFQKEEGKKKLQYGIYIGMNPRLIDNGW